MTEKLPRVTAGETIKALEKAGFSFHDRGGAIRYTKTKMGKEQLFHIIQARFSIPRP